MATLILNGVPNEAKRIKFISFLKAVFKRNGLSPYFWLPPFNKPMSRIKEVTVCFAKVDDALAASEILNNFDYMSNSAIFKLSATVDTDDSRIREEQLKRQSQKKKYQTLHKQRKFMLKNLQHELVQEAPSRSIEDTEPDFSNGEWQASPPHQSPPTRPKTMPKKKDLSGRPLYVKRHPNHIPRFTTCCKFLIREMLQLINKNCEKCYRKQLINIIRLKIRSRIAAALTDQNHHLLPKEISNIYRSRYPKDTDELFVQNSALGIDYSEFTQPKIEKKKSVQNWFIGSVSAKEDSSAPVNLENSMADITNADDINVEFDPNDMEDWN